jgi:threonine dehydrogenase-like Zn-dependent dehydrogenase
MIETKTMTQAVIIGPRQIEYQHNEIPHLRPDRVRVRVRACALCTWEQRVFAGIDSYAFPFVGGHEFAGIVEEIGSEVQVPGLQAGDLVAVSALKRCGQCPSCRRGLDNLCDNNASGRQPGKPWGPGGLGEYVVVPGYQIYKLGPDVTPYEAALVEPVACVLRSIKKAHLTPGDQVVIVGAGIMGMLHLLFARRQGAHVIVSELDEGRGKKALELGADEIINPTQVDFVERVRELTDGRGADHTFMAIGVARAIEDAVKATAKGGMVQVYASVYPKPAMITIDADLFHNREIVLTGTVSQDHEDFLRSAQIISDRTVDLRPLISRVFPLAQLSEAFDTAINKEAYRVLIDVTDGA